MKFIYFYLTFAALNTHKMWDENKFDSYFKGRYVKVFQIQKIEDLSQVRFTNYRNVMKTDHDWSDICRVTIDGQVAIVKQDCSEIVSEINRLK